jgi:phosphoribosylformylglycinamidine synthase subunit PurS
VKVRVLIRPKQGILDPQGKAVERALPALGFEGVSEVRIGRLVELEAEDGAELESLCEKLLANPLIEDYEVEEIAERAP